MILNGTYWKFVPKSSLDDMVRNIAVVNLKKCPGGAIASSKAVRHVCLIELLLVYRSVCRCRGGIQF